MGQAFISFHALFNFVLASGTSGIVFLFMLLQVLTALCLPGSVLSRPPAFWYAGYAGAAWLDRKLNRERRSQRERFFRGLAAVLVMTGAAFLLGYLVDAQRFSTYGWIVLLVFLSIVAQASLPYFFMARAVRLAKKGDRAGLAALLASVGRKTSDGADMHTLSRRVLETSAWLMNRFFIGPVFWFFLAGAPGAAVYIAVTALDRTIGHNDEAHRFFGWTAARLDDALNFIPARLTALLFVFAALFIPRGHPLRAVRLVFGKGRLWPGLNAGAPIAALAGALGVTLGGPGTVSPDSDSQNPVLWLGDEHSSARLKIFDLKRAKWLFGFCFLISSLLVCLLFLWQIYI